MRRRTLEYVWCSSTFLKPKTMTQARATWCGLILEVVGTYRDMLLTDICAELFRMALPMPAMPASSIIQWSSAWTLLSTKAITISARRPLTPASQASGPRLPYYRSWSIPQGGLVPAGEAKVVVEGHGVRVMAEIRIGDSVQVSL